MKIDLEKISKPPKTICHCNKLNIVKFKFVKYLHIIFIKCTKYSFSKIKSQSRDTYHFISDQLSSAVFPAKFDLVSDAHVNFYLRSRFSPDAGTRLPK